MNTISQSLFNNLTASRASFARAVRVHENNLPASIFCFVGSELHELIPRCVADASVEFMTKHLGVIAHHSLYVELFKGDYLIRINDGAGKFVSEVRSSIGYPFVKAGKLLALLLPVRSVTVGLAQSSLRPGKSLCIGFKKPRIIDFLPGREDDKRMKTDIYADDFIGSGQWSGVNLAGKTGIPFSVGPADRQSLSGSFDVPVLFDPYGTGLGKFKSVAAKTKAALREGEAIVSVEPPEPRVSGSFTRLDSAKEVTKGKIDAQRNILEALRIGVFKERVSPFPLGEKFARIVSRNGFIPFFPRLLSCLKRFIIYPATGIKRALQCLLLFCRGIQPVFVRFTHEVCISVLAVKVNNYLKNGACFHLPDKSWQLSRTKGKIFPM